ncbi:MAG: pyridoxamine 5'-phosphate oxidase family protein [Promethearchaeota archaeon]
MPRTAVFSDLEKDFLNNLRVARIATIDSKDNFPHIVPICFTLDESKFYTTLRKTSKRMKNIQKQTQVSLLFDEYEESKGKWITLKGILIKIRVSILNYQQHKEEFMKGWTQLIEKYPQYKIWAYDDLIPKDPDLRRIMRLEPISKVIWGFS